MTRGTRVVSTRANHGKGKVDGWREGRLSAHVTKPHLHDNSINTYSKFGNVILP